MNFDTNSNWTNGGVLAVTAGTNSDMMAILRKNPFRKGNQIETWTFDGWKTINSFSGIGDQLASTPSGTPIVIAKVLEVETTVALDKKG